MPSRCPALRKSTRTCSTGSRRAKEQRWLGEVAAIGAGLAAAEQKPAGMRDLAARRTTVRLGMPDFRSSAGHLDAEQ